MAGVQYISASDASLKVLDLNLISLIQVKKMICMILLKETTVSKEIHAELAECLLHTLSDLKPLVTTLDDYHLISRMCAQIRPYLIGEAANMRRLVSRLQKRSDLVTQLF